MTTKHTSRNQAWYVLFEYAEATLCTCCKNAVVSDSDRDSLRHNGEVLDVELRTDGMVDYCDFCERPLGTVQPYPHGWQYAG